MKRFRFVVFGSLLALLALASSPLAAPRVAAANGSGWPTCEFLNQPLFYGTYWGNGTAIDAKAGETVVVTATVTTSAPNQLMRLEVWDLMNGILIFENSGPIPGALAYTFPADGLYVVQWWTWTPDPANWIITAACATAPGLPPASLPAVFWPGDPDSPVYDGRINAEPADRYVVYCANSELQVWDGKNNIKMGAINFADISAMLDPSSQQIGDTVFLGRSNNILTVNIGPGAWIKDNIKLDECVGGLYKKK